MSHTFNVARTDAGRRVGRNVGEVGGCSADDTDDTDDGSFCGDGEDGEDGTVLVNVLDG